MPFSQIFPNWEGLHAGPKLNFHLENSNDLHCLHLIFILSERDSFSLLPFSSLSFLLHFHSSRSLLLGCACGIGATTSPPHLPQVIFSLSLSYMFWGILLFLILHLPFFQSLTFIYKWRVHVRRLQYTILLLINNITSKLIPLYFTAKFLNGDFYIGKLRFFAEIESKKRLVLEGTIKGKYEQIGFKHVN